MILFVFLVTGQPYFVDQPTPWPLQHAQYGFLSRFGPEGSVLGYAMIGIMDRFMLGISYGASNLIGSGSPEFYPRPELQAKLVLIEQQFYIPQVTLGFDSQGFGQYKDRRYQIKSKGFYLTGGEHFGLQIGYIDLSLGFNYSLESDDSKSPSLFAGLALGIGPSFIFLIDYDLGSNDPIASGPGYFNLGLRWFLNDQSLFEIDLRDLFSMHDDEHFNRMVKIGYFGSF
jgi:hypothetical protein